MPLVKDGALVADAWTRIADDAALPGDGAVTVSFKRWEAERSSLLGRNAPVGVFLGNTDPVEALASDLNRIGVVMLDFPKYTDGRAYSQARLLRERLGYRGELRATGNVLRDQLLFMRRSGFDTYEVDERGAAGFAASMAAVTHAYQPATNDAGMLLRRYTSARASGAK
ncbi:MAG: hypothetical protein JWL84_1555 [Rhodospirillales bacterium]|nr:hypothetical protein [Rhodospirillales bacterium]